MWLIIHWSNKTLPPTSVKGEKNVKVCYCATLSDCSSSYHYCSSPRDLDLREFYHIFKNFYILVDNLSHFLCDSSYLIVGMLTGYLYNESVTPGWWRILFLQLPSRFLDYKSKSVPDTQIIIILLSFPYTR